MKSICQPNPKTGDGPEHQSKYVISSKNEELGNE